MLFSFLLMIQEKKAIHLISAQQKIKLGIGVIILKSVLQESF